MHDILDLMPYSYKCIIEQWARNQWGEFRLVPRSESVG